MGGAPPLPLDFAPQGSKNGHFLAFFRAPRILLWVGVLGPFSGAAGPEMGGDDRGP